MLIEMLKSLLQKVIQQFSARDRYRPERHYMRGPGPRSRERETPDDAGKVEV